MICAERRRSSAVSTAVTSAFESVSPQGVWRPKDLRYQSLKSASPDLWVRLTVVAVDPVAREAAVAGHRALDLAVGVDRQRQRRPHQRRLPLHERARGAPGEGRGRPCVPPAVCGEANPAVALDGLLDDVGQPDRLEGACHRAELDRGAAHQPAPVAAEVGDRGPSHPPRPKPQARLQSGSDRRPAAPPDPRSLRAAAGRSGPCPHRRPAAGSPRSPRRGSRTAT